MTGKALPTLSVYTGFMEEELCCSTTCSNCSAPAAYGQLTHCTQLGLLHLLLQEYTNSSNLDGITEICAFSV